MGKEAVLLSLQYVPFLIMPAQIHK